MRRPLHHTPCPRSQRHPVALRPAPARYLWSALCISSLAGCGKGSFEGDSYRELMDEAVEAGLPGVALYVSSPRDHFDGAAGERQLGEADYQPDDLFRIASNSKSFLGVVAAQLAVEGRLDLDDPLADHLPAGLVSRIENADKATLRQALNHTSGMYDYLGSDGFWEEVDDGRTRAWTTEEALTYAYDEPASFRAGTDWEYSNTNYLLAGLVIDEVVGHHHSIEIRERILDPLGMTHTFYELEEPVTGDLVHGYSYYFERDELFDTDELEQGYGLADGGIVATAADIGTYIRALGAGDRLLSDPVRGALFGDTIETGEGDDYGLGISVFPSRYGDVVGHGGALEGYLSEMYYYPDEDTTIVVFTNTTDGYFRAESSPEDVFDDLIGAVERLTF